MIPDGASGRAEQIAGCFTGGIVIVWWLCVDLANFSRSQATSPTTRWAAPAAMGDVHCAALFVRSHCGFFFHSEFHDAASLFISYWILQWKLFPGNALLLATSTYMWFSAWPNVSSTSATLMLICLWLLHSSTNQPAASDASWSIFYWNYWAIIGPLCNMKKLLSNNRPVYMVRLG
jgi:hypothetical protein